MSLFRSFLRPGIRAVGAALALIMVALPGAASGGAAEPGALHFFGYGDLHYNSPRGSDFPDRRQSDLADPHRLTVGMSYAWTDRLSLDFEMDFEHALTAADLELEFAQVTYRLTDRHSLRAGVMLMPAGSLNEEHEPILYYSVERPQLDVFIIPSTWSEMGAGFLGSFDEAGRTRYRLFAVTNLDAAGFSADQGVRGGRGRLKSQNAHGAAVIGRFEWTPVTGLTLGVSGYHGDARAYGTVADVSNVPTASSDVNLWTGDLRFRRGPLELTGRYATLGLGNARLLSSLNGTRTDPVPERADGWLAEAALRLGQWVFPESERDLVPFIRFQNVNTQRRVPTGLTPDRRYDRDIWTTGLAFFPHPNVAFKADVELWKLATGAREERFNLGLAFQY